MGDSKSFLADFMPDIDSGTLNRWKSAIPQALNTFKSKINGIHPLEWVDKIMAQLEKSTDLDTIIEIIKQILGNQCFTLGVVVGMGKGLVSSVMELLALIKMFALAELEDLAHMKSDFAWDSQSMLKRFTTFPMMPNTLEIKIQLARLADKYFHDEMHEAAEQRDALLEELKQIITHPMKFLENLPDEFKKEFEKLVADLQRIKDLRSQNTLSSNYEAGVITGTILFEVISIILAIVEIAGVAVKVASKFPRLMKLAKSVSGKIKPKLPGAAKKPVPATKAHGTGGAAGETSGPKPKPSTKPTSNAGPGNKSNSGSGTNSKPGSSSGSGKPPKPPPKTGVPPKMEKKILYGEQVANPSSPGGMSNEVIGGHSPKIKNDPNFATEVVSNNPDGTTTVKYVKGLPNNNLSKIKKSTLAPDTWSDAKIIDTTKKVGDSPVVATRTRDGATLHRQTVDGVQWEVIKDSGGNVTSSYPTGGSPTSKF